MTRTTVTQGAACVLIVAWCSLLMVVNADEPSKTQPSKLIFNVTVGPEPGEAGPREWPHPGRLLVAMAPKGTLGQEPRLAVGQTERGAPTVLGRDIDLTKQEAIASIDARSAIFPLDNLGQLRPGIYEVQALLHTNPDLNIPNAPGDLYSAIQTVRIDPADGGLPISLKLSRSVPAETIPPDTELVKHVKIRSKVLSEFHGRPIHLRAGVILPRNFAREPDRRYPIRVHIGGYGARYTGVDGMMSDGAGFRRAWMAADAPPMILVHLDGAGPLGDPYQIDSANHGPYGAAVTGELIPHIEALYRGIGRGEARVLDGGSTGGWVALALQIFYPDFFNGAWSFCPDGVDFRNFELIDIYDDDNAYINQHGFERPAAHDVSGDVRFTMRHECRIENVLGRGDSWALSGGQWGAWNATYGPRGADGRPVALWDPITGKIDHKAAEHWKAYDLRRVLEKRWAELGPKLKGKLHIWIGEADDYFLNNAVHRLDEFLSRARPAYEGSITYGPGQGHCWMGISQSEMMKQMARRTSAASVHPTSPQPGG